MSSKAIFVALASAALASSQQLFEAVEPHMGTLVQIKLYAGSADSAKKAFQAAFARIAAVDAALTDYQPDSELNRVCRQAAGHDLLVSKDLFRVVKAAQKLAADTGGAFDITAGPATHLWRAARKTNILPTAAALAEARTRTGYRKLHVDPSRHTIRLDQDGMQLDLGGIAKGYAADEALLVLHAQGIQSALVAASGDLAFSDAPPGEPGWKIGVAGGQTLVLHNAAVSTSGDTEQHLHSAGKRYSHVIDTRTGMGLTTRLTVTVVARHGLDADGADTAVDALGAEAGLQFIERHPELAAALYFGEGGEARTLFSRRFPVQAARGTE